MRAAFVILSSDEATRLAVALDAAIADGLADGLVIDNASVDETSAVAAERGVRCLRLPQRVPYTEAMNAGLGELLGGGEGGGEDGDGPEAVALLQADTFVAPGYRSACLAALAADPRVGSVAPKLVRATGPAPGDRLAVIDAAGMTFDRRRKNRLVGHGLPVAAFASAAPVFGADGAAAMWRADALRDCMVDGRVFDQNMPGWGCDADLAWRGQLFGWRSAYAPSAVVHHIRTYSPTTRAAARPEDRRTQFRNRLLMIAKNDSRREVLRDLPWLLSYEIAAAGYALLVERELIGGYREAWHRLPEACRQRRLIRARRRVRLVPFGLAPPR